MTRFALSLTCALFGLCQAAIAQTPSSPDLKPLIVPGEELVYQVRSGRFGDIGTATLRVAGPDTVNGRPAYRLMFDFNARVVLFKVSDQTRSWLDVETLATTRYQKYERSPVGRRDETVEVNMADSSWTERGVSRRLGSIQPLDELAFIYLVRSLDAAAGDMVQLDRHFDAARNPARICVLGRENVFALGQNHEATVVQLEVPDARQGNGRSRLRFFIGAEPERLVLRIDTSMPVAGALTMTLISATRPDVPAHR